MKKFARIIFKFAVVWLVLVGLILVWSSIFGNTTSKSSENLNLTAQTAPWQPKQPKVKDQRIVPLIPSSTELVCAIGAEKFLVAASDYCNYPQEVVSKLPKIGDQNLNIEKIVSLKPTILLDTNSIHKRYTNLFKKLNLNYVNLSINSPADIPYAATFLASHLGDASLSDRFVKQWNSEVKKFQVLNPEEKPRVYIEIWDNPIQACGCKNNIDSILTAAGGVNVISNLDDFPSINSEMMIEANPDIIFLAYPNPDIEAVSKRPGWSSIKAVKNGHIFPLNQDILVRPSPRNLEAIKEMNKIIYKVVKDENN